MKTVSKKSLSRHFSVLAAAGLALFLMAPLQGERKLTPEQLETIKQGELVKEVSKEEGSRSASWSAGIYGYPPELMWKVITSLELYPKYIARNTVSRLLDEETMKKAVAAGDQKADEIEKLFAGMKPGFVRKNGDGTWTVYSYQRNQLPWPVNDRWILLEITHDDKLMRQTWKRLAGNIKEDYGLWKLDPLPDDPKRAIAQNEIHLDLDIPATGPFTAFAMDVSLPETYKAFEAMAADFVKNQTATPAEKKPETKPEATPAAPAPAPASCPAAPEAKPETKPAAPAPTAPPAVPPEKKAEAKPGAATPPPAPPAAPPAATPAAPK